MKLSLFSSLLAFLLLGCAGPSRERIDELARNGSIEADAPVQAVAQITIHASTEKSWGLLTGIDSWPNWQPAITEAKLSGPLQPGVEFTWKSGAQIHFKLVVVRPSSQLAWTGVAYETKAIHVWELKPMPGELTVVTTKESMQGPLLTLFYSSGKLEENEQQWLTSLKAAAEK